MSSIPAFLSGKTRRVLGFWVPVAILTCNGAYEVILSFCDYKFVTGAHEGIQREKIRSVILKDLKFRKMTSKHAALEK